MRKLFLIPVLFFGLILVSNDAEAQYVYDEIFSKEHISSRKPIPYKFMRESDFMYRKRVWRVIDLREKINLNLYYPTEPINDRISLIDLLMYGIKNEGIAAYNTEDDRFSNPIMREQIDANFGADERTETVIDENGDEQTIVIKDEAKTYEVKQYWVKEDWFFDNQHSTMDVRILGLCPIRFYIKDDTGEEDPEPRKSQVFWVYFPEVRRILANHEVFNNNNDAERKSFDDIFFKRYFNSFIIKVSNVYDDRAISSYSLGLQSLLEAERYKNEINDFEQDLWEY